MWLIIFACGRLSISKTSIDLTCFSWSWRRLTFACVFYSLHLIPASLTLTVDLSISSMLLIATTWARHFTTWLQKQLAEFVFVQWKKHKLSIQQVHNIELHDWPRRRWVVKNVGSRVATHSSRVRLNSTKLFPIWLVMNGLPLVTQHFLLPNACGVSLQLWISIEKF